MDLVEDDGTKKENKNGSTLRTQKELEDEFDRIFGFNLDDDKKKDNT